MILQPGDKVRAVGTVWIQGWAGHTGTVTMRSGGELIRIKWDDYEGEQPPFGFLYRESYGFELILDVQLELKL